MDPFVDMIFCASAKLVQLNRCWTGGGGRAISTDGQRVLRWATMDERNADDGALAGDAVMPYATPDAWRAAALKRPVGVDAAEQRRRREIAEAHHRRHGMPDARALADQELYIQGRMGLDEYRDYLLFRGMYGDA